MRRLIGRNGRMAEHCSVCVLSRARLVSRTIKFEVLFPESGAFKMAARIEPLMTVDDLDAMPEDGNRYEVIEGELFVSRAPGLPHQIISVNIVYEFKKYLDQHPIGLVIATPGLVFSEYSGVIPDIVFFTHGRGEEIISGERLVAAPDIVIEILSPGRENVSRDRVAKRQLYAKHGVNEYWIVDSENRA